MKVLISSIGSRGDVQPILALAVHAVRSQFPVLTEAAQGCDLVVAGGALQIATRSVCEALGIPYVFAAYCPAVLPSTDHPPPQIGTRHDPSLLPEANASLWAEEERRWNGLFRDTLNEERARRRLAPVESVQRHIFTDRPWLAADPVLGPAGTTTEMQIAQTGAWFLDDPDPLPDEVEAFLAKGTAPVYFGFGSMRAPEGAGRALIEAARTLGLRSIVSQGWANLRPIDGGADCLSIGDVAHERLFPRVAAVVHHGGAGTTAAAARAGRAQVVVPRLYDQYYWAHRVGQLGIGIGLQSPEDVTATAMTSALRACIHSAIAERARSLATRIKPCEARAAAVRLLEAFRPR